MGMAMGNPPPRAPYKTASDLMHCEDCYCTYSPNTDFVRGFRGRSRNTTPESNFHVVSKVPKGECPSCGRKEETTESDNQEPL